MREIKFRAWNPIHRQLLFNAEEQVFNIEEHPDLVQKLGMVSSTIFSLAKYHPDRNILMQYTGLKDKNGKEIYEGDIVKREGWIWEVIWHRYSWVFHSKSDFDRHAFFADNSSGDIEIIGNKYENPELLK